MQSELKINFALLPSFTCLLPHYFQFFLEPDIPPSP